MIKEFVKAWDANKENLRNYIASHDQEEYNEYSKIVRMIFEQVINPYYKGTEYSEFDLNKIHEIDDGDYQGTLMYLIPCETYQPSQWEYVITFVGYGSCSGCDTLLGISGYDDDKPTSEQVKEYMDMSIAKARENGYIETIFGRKRFLPDISSHNAVVRGYAERNAINAPIQGSAADIIKVAMINIYRRFKDEDIRSKMILQVHDELNFSVYPEEKEKVQRIVIEEMEKAYAMQVPLRADCGWGKNWLEAH